MFCFLKVVIRLNHGSEERRLGACEVIGAVGVQDRAVVLNLKEKILNHSSGHLRLVVSDESSDNEITVPAVHFIESTAGDDVRIWQEQQSVTRNVLRLQVSHMSDGLRQFPQRNSACLNALEILGRNFEGKGNVQYWLRLELWVGERGAV